MITVTQLWMPVIGSAIAVFVLSSLVHMVLKWHNSDYRKLANEDEVRTAIRASKALPGQYMVPYCVDMDAMKSPEQLQKFRDGPVGFIVLKANGQPQMGPALGLWFLYTVVVAIFAGYLASRALPAGAAFPAVFRAVATVAFLTFTGGSVQNGIWMGKPWRSVAKELLDGLIYGAAMGAVFGTLWPSGA